MPTELQDDPVIHSMCTLEQPMHSFTIKIHIHTFYIPLSFLKVCLLCSGQIIGFFHWLITTTTNEKSLEIAFVHLTDAFLKIFKPLVAIGNLRDSLPQDMELATPQMIADIFSLLLSKIIKFYILHKGTYLYRLNSCSIALMEIGKSKLEDLP